MSGRRKTWAEIKDVVRGVNQANVEARLIVEALLVSASKEEFVDLLMVAMNAGNSFDDLYMGSSDE